MHLRDSQDRAIGSPSQVRVTLETWNPEPLGPVALPQPSSKPIWRAPSPRSQAAVRTAQQGIPASWEEPFSISG